MLGKELSRNGRANTHDAAPDPLLSPFLLNISYQVPNCLREDELLSDDVRVNSDVTRSGLPFLVKSQSLVMMRSKF